MRAHHVVGHHYGLVCVLVELSAFFYGAYIVIFTLEIESVRSLLILLFSVVINLESI